MMGVMGIQWQQQSSGWPRGSGKGISSGDGVGMDSFCQRTAGSVHGSWWDGATKGAGDRAPDVSNCQCLRWSQMNPVPCTCGCLFPSLLPVLPQTQEAPALGHGCSPLQWGPAATPREGASLQVGLTLGREPPCFPSLLWSMKALLGHSQTNLSVPKQSPLTLCVPGA